MGPVMKRLKQSVSENHQSNNVQSSNSGREKYSDKIPVDLLIDIFLRLPSKSIPSLRCVSKFWASILGKPDIKELFLTKLSLPRLLFVFQVDDDKLFFYSSLQTPSPNSKSSSLVAVDHQTYFPTHQCSSSKICRPLNGLVCRQDKRRKSLVADVAVICNPTTGETVTLPEVRTKQIEERNNFIGYDPIEKQYKVLSMTWYPVNPFNIPQEHRVMTLGNGKLSWRKIEYCMPHHPLHGGICINGVVYYLADAVNFHSGVSMIVCFDVRSEKLRFVKIDVRMFISSSSSTLINYKGRFGVVQFTDSTQRNLELWVLEDAGKRKWLKHNYELPSLWDSIVGDTRLQVVGMTGTCDIVFSPYFLSDPFYVYYYNMERSTLTKLEIQGFEEFEQRRVYVFQDFVENVNL